MERMELAAELDAVATYIVPGAEGWGCLHPEEKEDVWTTTSRRVEARREVNRAKRYQRMLH